MRAHRQQPPTSNERQDPGVIRAGDRVSFHGEYEWNDKGGVIHWTHHDPDGRHRNGWIRHKGKEYQ